MKNYKPMICSIFTAALIITALGCEQKQNTATNTNPEAAAIQQQAPAADAKNTAEQIPAPAEDIKAPAAAQQTMQGTNVSVPNPGQEQIFGKAPAVGTEPLSEEDKILAEFIPNFNIDKTLDSALFKAVKAGNPKEVMQLLQKGANPQAKEDVEDSANSATTSKIDPMTGDTIEVIKDKKPIILTAIDKENILILKLLLKGGADVNTVISQGSSPLLYACEKGNKDVVKVLIDYGADVKYSTPFKNITPLKAAAKYPETVKVLKAAGAI